jgi:4-amino-4-deoxy-L-arabinose transferase-like glycosyltransferase
MANTPPLAGQEQSEPRGVVPRLIIPWLLSFTLLLALVLRIYNLDRLPGEIYGDIAIVYEYVAEILDMRWPTQFFLSAGPLYHYVITPIVLMGGLTYLTLKLASVVISLLGILGTFMVARELIDDDFGLIATFIAAVSSWWLIFSRLGNSQILIPLLVLGVLWFGARLARLGRRRDAIGCAVVAALGFYTYPQTFIVPPVMFVTLIVLAWLDLAVRREHLVIFAVTTLICAIPFGLIVAADPANFFTGYIGGKLESSGGSLSVLAGNALRGLLALHVRGDVVFRSNPTLLPHLDPISGVLFVVGVVYWLSGARRRFAPLLLIPFVLLQVPSMLVLSKPIEVPSASRTLGIAPIAYLLVASGLYWILRRWRSPVTGVAVVVLFLAVLLLNGHRYFRLYAEGLPNNNTPFGRLIAEHIDTLPPSTTVVMVGCCWGEWSQPEPKGVEYALTQPRAFRVVHPARVSCQSLTSLPAPVMLIWRPIDPLPAPQLEGCAGWLQPQTHQAMPGGPIFRSSYVEVTMANVRTAVVAE